MPPQPLSSVNRNAIVKGGSTIAFQKHPDLAMLVAQAIGAWAELDSTISKILIQMLGAHAEPAARMYAALRSSQAQFDALAAAARCSLQPRDLELFNALMLVVRPARRARHRLAHDIWCYSDDLPDALLLIEANSHFNFFVQRNIWEFQPDSSTDFERIRVFVYRERDLREILANFTQTHELLALFAVAAGGGPGAESNYHELVLEPPIQEALTRLRRQSGSAP